MTTQWTVEGSPEALRIFCMADDLCFPVLALSFPVARVHPTNEANPVLPVGSGLCATVKSLEAPCLPAQHPTFCVEPGGEEAAALSECTSWEEGGNQIVRRAFVESE